MSSKFFILFSYTSNSQNNIIYYTIFFYIKQLHILQNKNPPGQMEPQLVQPDKRTYGGKRMDRAFCRKSHHPMHDNQPQGQSRHAL